MTERKFKVGDRVRYVKSNNGARTDAIGQEGEVVLLWPKEKYPYDVKLESGATMYFADDELELADPPKAGDKVRITLERPVYGGTSPYVYAGTGMIFLNQVQSGTIEVIERAKPPIVLPTGMNAIVEIKDYRYLRVGSNEWLAIGSTLRFGNQAILNSAKDSGGTYRVIFEGEDD